MKFSQSSTTWIFPRKEKNDLASDKVYPSSKAAIADIPDGATILLGGFGGAGIPENLLVAMADHPARAI